MWADQMQADSHRRILGCRALSQDPNDTRQRLIPEVTHGPEAMMLSATMAQTTVQVPLQADDHWQVLLGTTSKDTSDNAAHQALHHENASSNRTLCQNLKSRKLVNSSNVSDLFSSMRTKISQALIAMRALTTMMRIHISVKVQIRAFLPFETCTLQGAEQQKDIAASTAAKKYRSSNDTWKPLMHARRIPRRWGDAQTVLLIGSSQPRILWSATWCLTSL